MAAELEQHHQADRAELAGAGPGRAELEAMLADVRADRAEAALELAELEALEAELTRELAGVWQPRQRRHLRLELARDALRAAGALTAPELAELAGVSPAQARARLRELVAAGTATAHGDNGPGRACRYRFVRPGTPPELPRGPGPSSRGPRVVALEAVPGTRRHAKRARLTSRRRHTRGHS